MMDTMHYVLGTACGPHPFPEMVTYFQSIIGREARRQMLKISKLPSRVYAYVGGGREVRFEMATAEMRKLQSPQYWPLP